MGTGQAMPHEPQFNGLVLTSMHEPLQFSRPTEQPALQAESSQTWIAAQAVSQDPQRSGSFDTLTQAPEQS
jgi:hypothetical protein